MTKYQAYYILHKEDLFDLTMNSIRQFNPELWNVEEMENIFIRVATSAQYGDFSIHHIYDAITKSDIYGLSYPSGTAPPDCSGQFTGEPRLKTEWTTMDRIIMSTLGFVKFVLAPIAIIYVIVQCLRIFSL